jgi:hypothetical protein
MHDIYGSSISGRAYWFDIYECAHFMRRCMTDGVDGCISTWTYVFVWRLLAHGRNGLFVWVDVCMDTYIADWRSAARMCRCAWQHVDAFVQCMRLCTFISVDVRMHAACIYVYMYSFMYGCVAEIDAMHEWMDGYTSLKRAIQKNASLSLSTLLSRSG